MSPTAHQDVSPAPAVPVVFRLAPPLSALAQAEHPLHERVRTTLAARVAALLSALGLPGTPEVELEPNDTAVSSPIEVYVHDRPCHLPNDRLGALFCYVEAVPLRPQPAPSAFLHRLLPESREEGGAVLLEFLALACTAALQQAPAVLLGPAQAAAYCDALPAPGVPDLPAGSWPPDAAWLQRTVAPALDLGRSLADRQAVADVLGRARAGGRTAEDAAEDFIAASRPAAVELRLSETYLREITATHVGTPSPFALMREGLFHELGVRYPDFRFVHDGQFRHHGFAFSLQGLTTLPHIGLAPSQRLVNHPPEGLQLLEIDSLPALNPANGNPCSITDAAVQQMPQAATLTTWDPLGYLILHLSAALRRRSAWFVDTATVRAYLDELAPLYPALIQAVTQSLSIEQITRTLRMLVTEGISIRDLRLILERMLDFDYVVTDTLRYIVFDDRLPLSAPADPASRDDLPFLVAFIRMGMKRYLSNKYTGGRGTLVVYLLDPALERLLLSSARQELAPAEARTVHDRFLQAFRAEMDLSLSGSSPPAILTTADLRGQVREVLAPLFPHLPVLAYQELTQNTSIQPLGRISLP